MSQEHCDASLPPNLSYSPTSESKGEPNISGTTNSSTPSIPPLATSDKLRATRRNASQQNEAESIPDWKKSCSDCSIFYPAYQKIQKYSLKQTFLLMENEEDPLDSASTSVTVAHTLKPVMKRIRKKRGYKIFKSTKSFLSRHKMIKAKFSRRKKMIKVLRKLKSNIPRGKNNFLTSSLATTKFLYKGTKSLQSL